MLLCSQIWEHPSDTRGIPQKGDPVLSQFTIQKTGGCKEERRIFNYFVRLFNDAFNYISCGT